MMCAGKRSFQDLEKLSTISSPPRAKRVRCSSSISPLPFSPSPLLPEEKESVGVCAKSNLPVNSQEWVELLVREMSSATKVDDAKSRATTVLESLEKFISARAGAEAAAAAKSFHEENTVLKERIEELIGENDTLRKARSIHDKRQKMYDDREQELQQLKKLVAQNQQQLQTLELKNYSLSFQLQQALPGKSMPQNFLPYVF